MTSTTISPLNTGYTAEAEVVLPALDVEAFALVDFKASEDGLSKEAVYQLLQGSVESPLYIRVGHYKNLKANGGIGSTNMSVKLTTASQKADVDDVIWTSPEVYTLAKSSPGAAAFTNFDHDKEAIGAIVSVMFNVVAGVVTANNMNEMNFGVVNRVLEHANTPA